MSYLNRTKSGAPAVPAANKSTQYVDTAGPGFTHELDDKGVDNVLTQTARFNWIRNSGFWWAQRQTPGTLTTYGGSTNRFITADGWGVISENASMQYIRTNTGAAPEAGLQNQNYGNFTKITSAGKLIVTQILEQRDSDTLRTRTIRLQFWAKSLVAASQNFRLGLVQWTGTADAVTVAGYTAAFGGAGVDPTLGATLAYIAPKATVTGDNCTVNGNAADFTVTSVWQRFGCCFDVPNTAAYANLIAQIWSNAQVAATNGIAISQVSLTDGFEIQAWSPRDSQAEFARVQRFFNKSFAADTAPATSLGFQGSMVRGHVSVAGIAASQPIGLRFPVEMCIPLPVITFFNPSAANALVRNSTAGSDSTATGTTGLNQEGATITFTGIAAWTVAQAVVVNYQADGEI